MEKVQSTCNLCALSCNLDFYVEDNHIIKVQPTANYPVNMGFSCIKGLNLSKQQTKIRNRKGPLLRDKNGVMQEVSWEVGFKTFAEKIKDIQSKYGKESAAYISTGQMTTEDMAILGHVGRSYLGMHGDGNTRLCMATAVVAYKQSFGFDAPPYTLRDAELSDTLIFVGSNPVIAHPVLWGRIRNNTKAKIIVIDPRRSETALNAHMWIDVKPKADLTLLYTIANILIENDWIDKDYIEANTEEFEGFKEHVKSFTLDEVEARTGISKERALELAKVIHEGERVSFWWTMGVNQGYQATRTAQGIINLALMTGNIGRPGTGPNSLTGQCNAMGSRMFSNTTGFYGGGDYTNDARRKQVAAALGVSEDFLPTKPTIAYDQIISRIETGEIKALWVICTNPRHSFSDNSRIVEAFKKLEFLVVQDIFEDTHTAKLADLYLPSVAGTRKDGVIINTERRLSKVNPVIRKRDYEKTDYEIIYELGKTLGMGESLENWKTPRAAFEMLKKCSKGMPCDITGVTYELLEGAEKEGSKGVQWPFPLGATLESEERRLFEDGKYYTESKKAKFIYEDILDNPNKADEEYPYILNTGRGTVGQWHTSVRSREFDVVCEIANRDSYVLINPELAKELNIKENERITIKSQNGKESEFDAVYSENVKKNQLFAPMHYIQTNNLTPSVFDTYSREPSYKSVPINIVR